MTRTKQDLADALADQANVNVALRVENKRLRAALREIWETDLMAGTRRDRYAKVMSIAGNALQEGGA